MTVSYTESYAADGIWASRFAFFAPSRGRMQSVPEGANLLPRTYYYSHASRAARAYRVYLKEVRRVGSASEN
jgi:hypothetical protein